MAILSDMAGQKGTEGINFEGQIRGQRRYSGTGVWLWTYNHGRPNMVLGGITLMKKLAFVT
jgi:hypothetical protein